MRNYKFKIIIFFGVILAVFLLPKISWAAEDIYVSQTAAGGDTGVDCANAHSMTWLNTDGNWGAGAGKVSAGDRVHLCRTLTTPLTAQGSGSSGSPIILLFETGAKFSTGAITDGAAYINLGAYNYITVDGGTNGIIESTDNGTGKTYQRDQKGVSGIGDNITIQNLTIKGMYVRAEPDCNRYGYAIVAYGSNILIQNNTLRDGDGMVVVLYNGSRSNVAIKNNTIGYCNHGIFIDTYGATGGTLAGCEISGNTIDHFDPYSTTVCGADLHVDGIIISNDSSDGSGAITNLKIFNNTIGPNTATPNTTSAMWISGAAITNYPNALIYNNLFLSNTQWNAGFVGLSGGTFGIYNNTFSGVGMNVYCNQVSVCTARGNIINGLGTLFAEAYMGVIFSDYNDLYGNTNVALSYKTFTYSSAQSGWISCENVTSSSGGGATFFRKDSDPSTIELRNISGTIQSGDTITGTSSGKTAVLSNNGTVHSTSAWDLTNWRTYVCNDVNSITSDPKFVSSSDFRLQSSSLAINAFPTAQAPASSFSVDKDGISRPQGSAWDIGAYEYVEAAPDTTPPSPPVNVVVS